MAANSAITSSFSSGDKDSSLWLQLLRQSRNLKSTTFATGDKESLLGNQSCSCIVISENSSIRSPVVASLSEKSNLSSDSKAQPSLERVELLTCSTISVDLESTGETEVDVVDVFRIKEDSRQQINIWSCDSKLFPHVASQILPKNDRVAFLVVLDVSKDETSACELLLSTLKNIASYCSSTFGTTEEGLNEARKQAIYLSSARTSKGEQFSDDPLEASADIDSRFIWASSHFPMPVLVIGWRPQEKEINLNDVLTLKAQKELQGKLRSICLEAGAALLVSSQEKEASPTGVIRRYMLHRLYPRYVRMSLEMDERLDGAFIPSGFDTADLIAISTGLKSPPAALSLQQAVENGLDVSKLPVSEASGGMSSITFTDIEPEQQWLADLQSFLSQVSDSISLSVDSASLASSAATSGIGSSGIPRGVNLSDVLQTDAETNIQSASGNSSALPSSSAVAGDKLGDKKRPVASRKPSVVAGGEKGDATDFFKSLLSNNPKK